MPLVVLEGADGCGKTTLAKKLMDMQPGAHYIHATYRFPSRMTLYHLAIIRQAIRYLDRGYLVIVDRWWPSELIYGKVYRQRHEPLENLRMLHRLGLRHGVTYVLCHRENRERQREVFTELKKRRSEMYDDNDQVGQLHDEYQELWNVSANGQEGRWVTYNCDRATESGNYVSFMLNMIYNSAMWYDRLRKRHNMVLPHSTGNLTGGYVMVGEKINPTHRSLLTPWVGFKGSSFNITNALRTLGKSEHHFLWTNAEGPRGHDEKLRTFLESAGKHCRVIAMGDVARKFCESAGRCDYAMPHPAYLTRFHGQDSLISVLEKVLT